MEDYRDLYLNNPVDDFIIPLFKQDNIMNDTLAHRITSNPEICHGKPCIRGLRYPVETVLEWLGSGMSVEEILNDYEDLEREDVMATLNFASRLARIKRIEMLAA